MRKKISALFVAVLTALCLCLSGCHGSRGLDAFEMPDGFDESKSYEISFWAKNDTNVTQTKIYEQAIEDFEKLYPNIKVNMLLYTDYKTIYNDVITNISTGTTPNVCISYPDHIATYLTGTNVVVPLDELIEDEEYGLGGSALKYDGPTKDEVIEKFLDECYIGESCYALPYMRSTEACYINVSFLNALGYELPDVLTWDFVWEVSEKALEKKADGETFKVNNQKVLIPCIYKSTDNMMIQMLAQCGLAVADDEGNVLLFNDTTKSLLEEIEPHARSEAFSTFKISSYPANFLDAGQCIFAIDSTAGATWMGSDAPNSDIPEESFVDFEIAVRTIPLLDEDNPLMISQGPSLCVFNKADSGEVLASWLFAQYLLTNEVQIAYAKTEGYVPVTSKARETEEYKEYLANSGIDNDEHYSVKIDATKMLLENTENTFITSVFNGSASVRDAAGQLIENVCKSARRNQTVDDSYYEKLWSDVTTLYRLGQGSESVVGEKDLGPLPSTSVILLCALGAAWVIIIIYYVLSRKNKRQKKQ